MTSDHAVFKRLSRQQLIVRRRSVGVQVLIFTTSVEPLRCRRCGRTFNAVWKALLCHICGLWACHSCSSVIECERDVYVIRYVRACVPCMSLVNKWPDPDLLGAIVATPWVVQSTKSQLGINLAETLRATPYWRRAVLKVLRHLGQPAIEDEHTMLDNVAEHDWISTMNHTHEGSSNGDSSRHILLLLANEGAESSAATTTSDGRFASVSKRHLLTRRSYQERREFAHLLVQQCFDISVEELPLAECVFAESNGARSYPILYDEDTEWPADAPEVSTEADRVKYIEYYGLTEAAVTNTLELQLLCDLAAKELDALTAYISIIRNDTHQTVACRPDSTIGTCGALTKRSQTMCAFGLVSRDRPFLVRDAALDFRFRNVEAVVGDASIRFYIGFPIISESGVHVATLCVIDNAPRRQISTMQYSILKMIAAIVSRIWEEQHGAVV